MGLKMFCGELEGEVIGAHIFYRAREVRDSVGFLFDCEDLRKGWREAALAGWRVIPVEIRSIEPRR